MADNIKLMNDAIDGAINEFRGAENSYKLDEVLENLEPTQKFNSEQLKGYLLKQGVSPYEIDASPIFKGFENANSVLSAAEWIERLEGEDNASRNIE